MLDRCMDSVLVRAAVLVARVASELTSVRRPPSMPVARATSVARSAVVLVRSLRVLLSEVEMAVLTVASEATEAVMASLSKTRTDSTAPPSEVSTEVARVISLARLFCVLVALTSVCEAAVEMVACEAIALCSRWGRLGRGEV